MLLPDITPVVYSVQESFDHENSFRTIREYKYSSVYKIMYALQGSCQISLYDRQTLRTTIQLSKGNIICFLPGQKYTTKFYNRFSNLNIYFSYTRTLPLPHFSRGDIPPLHISSDRLEETSYPSIEPIRFDDYTAFNDVIILRDTHHLISNLRILKQEYSGGLVHSEEYLSAVMKCLLIDIARQIGKDEQSYSLNTANRIIDYISKNLDKALNCTSISAALGYHPNYVNSVIRTACGVNLHTYIDKRKINESLHYLEETDISITEIAYLLGYSSSSHFCKVFNRITGMTPTAFRKSFNYFSSNQQNI